MKSVVISSPVDLTEMRGKFECQFNGRNFNESDISDNLTVIGIVTGYRRVQMDPDSTQVFLDLSQGSNEEFRLSYLGWFSKCSKKKKMSLQRQKWFSISGKLHF